jgi:hypothetical protein
MIRVVVLCSMLAFVGFQRINADDKKVGDEGPSSKVPELKVLEHYAGEWTVEFANKDLSFTSANVKAKWILDGRFLEQSNDLLDKNGASVFKIKTLMTFDKNRNAYRSWLFTSDGVVIENDCVWDEKAKTMTSISKRSEGEGFFTTTADFSTAGLENWKIAIADAAGKTTSEIVGKNTRKKAK